MKRIIVRSRRLTCSCCGQYTQGRQWFNQDTGYSICPKCVDLVAKGMTVEEFRSSYGIAGVHFDVARATVHDGRTA